MKALIEMLGRSPVRARVVPFAVFLVLTAGQGLFGEASRYWLYLVKTIIGLGLIWVMRPLVSEMRWKLSWEAVVIGAAVFAVWVSLSGEWVTQPNLWAKLGLIKPAATEPKLWNPHVQFGNGTALAWLFVVTRIAGSTFVVPPLEEVFYRSFLYRYFTKRDFQSLPLAHFAWVPFLLTSAIFGFVHREWLAGILCGFAYQGLVIWKKRLGDAMTAHAITNFLLGLWVVWKGAWQFW
jgi:CAAX prenyl protease-like protein